MVPARRGVATHRPRPALWNTVVVADDLAAGEPAPSPGSRGEAFRGRRVASNSAAMLGGRILFALLGFATTPVILDRVGLVEFGLWTLIMTTVAYITVVDPGFGDLITRYGARAHLAGDRAVAARLCSLASLVWLGFGILGLPLLLWAIPAWVPHLHLHHGLAAQALDFFDWGYAYTVFGCLTAILSARLTAIGDQWLVTLIDATTRLLYVGVLLGMLLSGSRLSALVVSSSVQLLVTYVVTMGFVWARAGAPYGNPRRLHGDLVREATRFGSWLQLGGVLELLTYETDGLVVGTIRSVRLVGTYGIATTAAGMTTYFGFFAQPAMLAAISAAYAAGEGLQAMRRMYRRAVRLVSLIGGTIAGGLLGLAPVFLAFWLNHYGGGVALTDGATCLAVGALLVALPRPAAAATIMAMGKVGIGVRAQLAAFCINLVLTIALVKPLGLIGVMLATLVAKSVASGYLLVRFHRLVEGGTWELFGSWASKLLAAIAAGAGACRLVLLVLPTSVVHDRWPALVALVPLGLLYLGIVAVVIRATSFFSQDDLDWFAEILPGRLRTLVDTAAVRRLASRSAAA